MSPTPKRQPMVNCRHCGTPNDPARGATKCRNCQLPLNKAAVPVARADAMRNAGQVLADARARIAAMTAEEIADAAAPGSLLTRDQILTLARELRDRTRNRGRIAA